MLYGAEAKRMTGTVSILVPVESGVIGNYTTMVRPMADDS